MKRETPRYIIEVSKKLRKNQTNAERILWDQLRGNKLKGYKFRRQYAIGRYIADFYCCEARLAIELDGEIHNLSDRKEYDTIRQTEIEARNIVILRFSNEEIYYKMADVLQRITDTLAPRPSSGEGLG